MKNKFYNKILNYKLQSEFREDLKHNLVNTTDVSLKIQPISTNGKRCLIAANGPSIDSIDFALLSPDVDVVSCSDFVFHKDFNKINIKYHVFSPYLPHADASEANIVEYFSKRIISNKINYGIFKKDFDVLRKLNFMTSSNLVLYSPWVKEKFVDKISIDFNKMMFCHNISLYALQFAVIMDYKEIYLAGVDFSYFNSDEKIEKFKNIDLKFSYSDFAITKKYLGENFQLIEEIYLSFKQFRTIDRIASQKHIKIFNTSNTSIIDCFPHRSFNDLAK